MPNQFTNGTVGLSTTDRFFRYVEFTDTCWIWGGALREGYGAFWDGYRMTPAHRWAYELCVRPIPKGLQIDHLCRVTACVNPEHLEPVTNYDNLHRSPLTVNTINAAKTHCKNGHEYNVENTLYYSGRRRCRVCDREIWNSGRR